MSRRGIITQGLRLSFYVRDLRPKSSHAVVPLGTPSLRATLVNGELNHSEHWVIYNVKDLPGGVYLYWLQVGNFAQQKKMMVVK
jgi:hypothetical protein